MTDDLTSGPSDSNSSTTTKRPRLADSVSPTHEQRDSSLAALPGNICGHCGKECTAKGKLSEAVQCDLCYMWLHASCEGISKEQYRNLSHVCNSIANVAYYCEFNHCHSRVKQLVARHVNANANVMTTNSDLICEQSVNTPPSPNLSSKVMTLSEQTSQLENKVNQILDSLKSFNQPHSSHPAHQDNSNLQSNIAVDLVDALADCESRKCNLIVYNLLEGSTPNAETKKSLFTNLCNSLNLEVHITTVTRLGKKTPDKNRPLRVCLDNEVTKRRVLSQSAKLRLNPDWKNVYVNPDMTLAERNANRLLRQELRERRNKGEKNLVIRRNKIVLLSKPPPTLMETSSPPTNAPAHAPASSSSTSHDQNG